MESPPSMDYPQMSIYGLFPDVGVSTDTLTEGICSICGVSLDVSYGQGCLTAYLDLAA